MVNLFQPFGEASKKEKKAIVIFWTAVFFIAWQYFPGYLIPRPLGTLRQLIRLYDNGLSVDVWVSSWVIIRSGFLIAFPLGCLLSYLYTIRFFRPAIVAFAILRNTSMNALVAAFIMMSLGGDTLKVVTMAFVITVYFVSSVIQHYDSISKKEIDHAVSMRMSSWQILWHRVIRGRLHLVCYDFIPCLGMGWATLSFVEGLARDQGGLGDLMLQVDKISSYEGILALAIISIIFGFGMWALLKQFIRKTFKYATQISVHS